ncbi:hypothetical protein [Magnetococcus sp. PR-3]|uniref:hypothetical protein n=1 Tax=Magnetococcus sp. PR-3 TaxID=3120355 RepID=UPI002FCDFD4D
MPKKPPFHILGWRRWLLYLLTGFFALLGLGTGASFITQGMHHARPDDIYAGLFMGACLLLIATLLGWILFKRQPSTADTKMDGTTQGVMVAHMLNLSDDLSSEDMDGDV